MEDVSSLSLMFWFLSCTAYVAQHRNGLSSHIYSSSLVFVLLSRKYKFKCKVFRIMFIFHSTKDCKIAQEVKFARIAHDYQFYVNMGGFVTC